MNESSIVNLQSVRHDHTAPAPAVKSAVGVFCAPDCVFHHPSLFLFHAQLFACGSEYFAPSPAGAASLFVPLWRSGGEQRALHFRLCPKAGFDDRNAARDRPTVPAAWPSCPADCGWGSPARRFRTVRSADPESAPSCPAAITVSQRQVCSPAGARCPAAGGSARFRFPGAGSWLRRLTLWRRSAGSGAPAADVFTALAQRRQVYADHVQAVEQILAELAFLHPQPVFWCVAAMMRTSTFTGA